MNENQRVRRNKYRAKRRKMRNLVRQEKAQDDRLYEEARITPDTVEGQSVLSIDRLSPETTTPPVSPVQDKQPGWISYLTWGLIGN